MLILEIGGTPWNISGEFTHDEGDLVFSGKESRSGIAIVIERRYRNLALGARVINNRLAVVRMEDSTFAIYAYAPTTAVSEEEIDEFFSVLEETMASLLKSGVKSMMKD